MPIPFLFQQQTGLAKVLNGSQFYAPRTSSITQTRGSGTPTITRATTATVQNNDGYLVTALSGEIRQQGARRVRNLIATTSEDFSNAAWTKNSGSFSGGLFTCAAATAQCGLSGTSVTVLAGTYIQTWKIKPNGIRYAQIWAGGTSYAGHANVDLTTGVVSQIGGAAISASISAADADGYFTVSVKQTVTAGTYVAWLSGIDSGTAARAASFTGDGIKGFYVATTQLEDVTAQTTQTAGEYVSVGVLSAPYHGAGVDGVAYKTTDISGNPIPAATRDGSVVEAARTNLCLKSQEFDDVFWTADGVSVTANDAVAPDGTLTADKITLTASNDRHRVYNGTAINYSAGNYTLSVYVKPGTVSWFSMYSSSASYASFNATGAGVLGTSSGVVSADIEALDDGWYRLSVVILPPAGSATANWNLSVGSSQANLGGPVVTWLAVGTETAYIWGAQVELGSFASTYIPTTTAAATRNKDVPDDQVSGNLTAAAGSVAFQWTPSHAPSGTIALGGSYVDANNSTQILHDATNLILRKRIGGVDKDATIALAFASGTTYKVAVRWGAGGIQVAVNGVLGTPDADATAAQLGTRWQWGADGNSLQQAGACFKEKYLYTRALSDSELQATTA